MHFASIINDELLIKEKIDIEQYLLHFCECFHGHDLYYGKKLIKC